MVNVVTALDSAKKLDEAVGLVSRMVGKLRANPDAAAMKLSEALDEIGKTYRAVDEGIAAYLGLAFVAQGVDINSQALLKVQGGSLLAEVERGRGHCHRIGAIYRTFLDKWFERTVDHAEYLILEEVFKTLGETDLDAFRGFVDLAQTLQQEADQVLDLILADRGTEAHAKLKRDYASLKPLRLELGGAMNKLYALRNEFLEITGVV